MLLPTLSCLSHALIQPKTWHMDVWVDIQLTYNNDQTHFAIQERFINNPSGSELLWLQPQIRSVFDKEINPVTNTIKNTFKIISILYEQFEKNTIYTTRIKWRKIWYFDWYCKEYVEDQSWDETQCELGYEKTSTCI